MRNRATLAPDRMTDAALWRRVDGLIAASYYVNGLTPRERDQRLDELTAVIRELRLRGTQLALI